MPPRSSSPSQGGTHPWDWAGSRTNISRLQNQQFFSYFCLWHLPRMSWASSSGFNPLLPRPALKAPRRPRVVPVKETEGGSDHSPVNREEARPLEREQEGGQSDDWLRTPGSVSPATPPAGRAAQHWCPCLRGPSSAWAGAARGAGLLAGAPQGAEPQPSFPAASAPHGGRAWPLSWAAATSIVSAPFLLDISI